MTGKINWGWTGDRYRGERVDGKGLAEGRLMPSRAVADLQGGINGRRICKLDTASEQVLVWADTLEEG